MFLLSRTIVYSTKTKSFLVGMVTLVVIASLAVPAALAAVMSSGSYRMTSDSINVGGGRSTSSSYRAEDTAGEVATGEGSSTTYRLHAGYQQMDASTISMTAGGTVTLTALSMSQQSAVGSASWTVTTDDPAGYGLSVHASTTPALKDTGHSTQFTDFHLSTPGTWSVTSAYEFGFSARGTDVSTGTWGSDTDCLNTTDVPSTTLKWRGFNGTTDISIAGSSSATPSGTATVMCVASQESGVFAPSGTYAATVTATAVAN